MSTSVEFDGGSVAADFGGWTISPSSSREGVNRYASRECLAPLRRTSPEAGGEHMYMRRDVFARRGDITHGIGVGGTEVNREKRWEEEEIMPRRVLVSVTEIAWFARPQVRSDVRVYFGRIEQFLKMRARQLDVGLPHESCHLSIEVQAQQCSESRSHREVCGAPAGEAIGKRGELHASEEEVMRHLLALSSAGDKQRVLIHSQGRAHEQVDVKNAFGRASVCAQCACFPRSREEKRRNRRGQCWSLIEIAGSHVHRIARTPGLLGRTSAELRKVEHSVAPERAAIARSTLPRDGGVDGRRGSSMGSTWSASGDRVAVNSKFQLPYVFPLHAVPANEDSETTAPTSAAHAPDIFYPASNLVKWGTLKALVADSRPRLNSIVQLRKWLNSIESAARHGRQDPPGTPGTADPERYMYP
ncbi:hypothetical protein FB451DRAFT_1162356 [Mycena latifolia]|nr:hypothetical protein FB451DRAFT_1162356 [Mycena latifolia]